MLTKTITFVCHRCGRQQEVEIPQMAKMKDYPEALMKTACKYGVHALYSKKLLEKEIN